MTAPPPDPETLLAEAVTHHQAGRLAEAHGLYRAILARDPEHLDALHLLGMLAHQMGDDRAAESLIGRAVEIDPRFVPALVNLGLVRHALGRFAEAAETYRRALALAPDMAEAHNNLGNALVGCGNPAAAETAFRQALACRPAFPEAWSNLANAQLALDRPTEAAESASRALALKPDFPEALGNLGRALQRQGREPEALAAFRRAVATAPSLPEMHFNLGTALAAAGNQTEAVKAYRTALAFKPDYLPALKNLGAALEAAGRPVEAEAVDRQALALVPGDAELLNNLGGALKGQDRLDEAMDAFRRALAANPHLAPAHYNLGTLLLASLGDANAALPHLQAATDLDPARPAWRSAALLALHYAETVTARHIAAAHRAYGATIPPAARPAGRARAAGEPLRIGFVSADFRRHATWYLLTPLLQARDHTRWTCHLYSSTPVSDSATDEFHRLADSFVDATALDDAALTARIAADGIDVLIDLQGHTRDNRLGVFARRPAPRQGAWLCLDYVWSSDLPQMDFIITDLQHVGPEEEGWFAERVLRLPNVNCYRPPADAPEPAPPPCLASGHITFGCFNALFKISPGAIRAWGRILTAMPDARLVLATPMFRHPEARQRMLALLAESGVAAARVDLLGPAHPQEMLERYARIDIALDSFPYSGGLTTLEALWMGVPVVTFPGDRPAGRHSADHLRTAGLDELVAKNADGYVELAVTLARDRARLQDWRGELRRRLAASPVTDAAAYARAFEGLLAEMTS